ncbi:MAG: hypothetical protein R6T99_03515 [Bacteroidales bacterium]
MEHSNSIDPKVIAVLSYVTFIGWIIAIIFHQNNRSEFGAFHIRQSLGLFITGLVFAFIPVVGWILNVVVFIFWLLGLIYAAQGEQKVVPLVGDFYQNLFRGLH